MTAEQALEISRGYPYMQRKKIDEEIKQYATLGYRSVLVGPINEIIKEWLIADGFTVKEISNSRDGNLTIISW